MASTFVVSLLFHENEIVLGKDTILTKNGNVTKFGLLINPAII